MEVFFCCFFLTLATHLHTIAGCRSSEIAGTTNRTGWNGLITEHRRTQWHHRSDTYRLSEGRQYEWENGKDPLSHYFFQSQSSQKINLNSKFWLSQKILANRIIQIWNLNSDLKSVETCYENSDPGIIWISGRWRPHACSYLAKDSHPHACSYLAKDSHS